MAVAPEAEALLRRTYDAFNRKDFRTAGLAFHPDVEWTNLLDKTRVTGARDLQAYFERQFQVIEARVEPQSFDDAGDGAVAVRLHQVVRFLSDGEVLVDCVIRYVFRFRDGLITAVDVDEADRELIIPRRRRTSDA